MVSSVCSNMDNYIQPLLNGFKNNINSGSLKDIKISDVPNETSMATSSDEDTLKSFANLNLHQALYNADNKLSNRELLCCIPKILEKASPEDLANYISKACSNITSSLDGLNELIKNTGLDNDSECQKFLAEATKNSIEKLIKKLNFENELNELQEDDDEIQSLFDMMEKYNQNLKSNLAMRYEV